MKYLTITLISFFFSLFIALPSIYGQSLSREFGLRGSSFDNVGFIYKNEKKPGNFTRYRFLFSRINFQQRGGQSNFAGAFGIAIGKEKRKTINQSLKFIHGIEPTVSLSFNASSERKTLSVTGGIGYVLGFQYDIAKNFYVNIETIPAIGTYFRFDNGNSDGFGLTGGFNSNTISLSLVYRFEKKNNT